ncbi:MAG: CPBP family intramembrane metalloprotease [Caldilineales bacterium]|nr:CPBP family intramembrane metalloprotease [Caldilineales bacterium]MDW8318124.1 type II CAAX endopeptidase family protein [Anaerolineae bacterium]
MSNNVYLSLADQGKNAWWRYLVGVLLIVIVWALGNAALLAPVLSQQGQEALRTPMGFALSLLGFVPLLLGTWLATVWIHRRRFGSLIGPSGRLNLRRVGTGMAVWAGLMTAASLGEAALFGSYALNRNFLSSWPFLLIAITMLPVQTSAEEFFFRGYLLQAKGRLTQRWGILAVVNGILFTLPHLVNPEAAQEPVFATLAWFVFGVFFTLVTLRSGTLDYALGIHAMNNVYTAVFFGYEGGVLPASALFVTPELHGPYSLISLVAAAAIAYWLLFRRQGQMATLEAPSQA